MQYSNRAATYPAKLIGRLGCGEAVALEISLGGLLFIFVDENFQVAVLELVDLRDRAARILLEHVLGISLQATRSDKSHEVDTEREDAGSNKRPRQSRATRQ